MTRARWPAAEERSLENPTVSLMGSSTEELLSFFGGTMSGAVQLPPVTIETALEVPAVSCAVFFLSRSLASVPLHAYRGGGDTGSGEQTRVGGDLQMLLNEAPNPEWSSFGWRQYHWQQVFTGGRGMTWIERQGVNPVALWPMDPLQTTIRRVNGRKIYRVGTIDYPAADVIDVPFALKADQLGAYSPVYKGRNAIALMLAMSNYAGSFFASGGVPPLALEGPLPAGAEAYKRAASDIQRAVDLARKEGRQFFGMPPGHKLSPIGTDPDKGQMTEARRFQLEEVARIWQIPPVFLQDLTNGTFANTEQQDLALVKHLLAQWAKAFEDELNLKLFGQRRRARYVEHNLDGLLRGDFLSRINAIGRAVQTAQLTPNEGRALENRPPKPKGDELYIQGATVPLGTQPTLKAPKDPADQGDPANDGRRRRKYGRSAGRLSSAPSRRTARARLPPAMLPCSTCRAISAATSPR